MSCGTNSLGNASFLSIDMMSCVEACNGNNVADSKNRCIAVPSFTETFEIVTEKGWNITDQILKRKEVKHDHILSSLTCQAGWNLIAISETINSCKVCSKDMFYDPSSKMCAKCSSSCIECESLTSCKVCNAGAILTEGQCRWGCDRGYFKDTDNTCVACHENCDGILGACSGSAQDDCTGCSYQAKENGIMHYLDEFKGICVST